MVVEINSLFEVESKSLTALLKSFTCLVISCTGTKACGWLVSREWHERVGSSANLSLCVGTVWNMHLKVFLNLQLDCIKIYRWMPKTCSLLHVLGLLLTRCTFLDVQTRPILDILM